MEENISDAGVAKVKLLRHSGVGGACDIDGDEENQIKLLRHSNGVLMGRNLLTL